jgi:hypothetical protein
MFREHLMKADNTSSDSDLSSIPSEFRENYKFLSELIDCRRQNTSVTQNLEEIVRNPICTIRAKLNRRQRLILSRLLRGFKYDDNEPFAPPVPPELEASLRLRKSSTWLPWEAEAIEKIERWRADISLIAEVWAENSSLSTAPTRSEGTVALLRRSARPK